MTEDEVFDVLTHVVVGFNFRTFFLSEKADRDIRETCRKSIALYTEYLGDRTTKERLFHLMTVMATFEEEMRRRGEAPVFPDDVVGTHERIVSECRRVSESENDKIIPFPSLIIENPL
jgi:hypothetical protein